MMSSIEDWLAKSDSNILRRHLERELFLFGLKRRIDTTC